MVAYGPCNRLTTRLKRCFLARYPQLSESPQRPTQRTCHPCGLTRLHTALYHGCHYIWSAVPPAHVQHFSKSSAYSLHKDPKSRASILEEDDSSEFTLCKSCCSCPSVSILKKGTSKLEHTNATIKILQFPALSISTLRVGWPCLFKTTNTCW